MTRGLSDRPLDSFGIHLFRLSDRPLDSFGMHLLRIPLAYTFQRFLRYFAAGFSMP